MSPILFPHSNVSEGRLKTISFFLGPITLFQPWFMDPPPFISDINPPDILRVMHPPKVLMPDEPFKALLAEYRGWIVLNRGKGQPFYPNVNQGGGHTGEHTWEIRKMIRRVEQPAPDSIDPPSFKWHLILHLAREIEDNRNEAEKVLEALRVKKSPLQGSVDSEEELKDLFEDLPRFDSEPFTGVNHWDEIFEAWFGLFGGTIHPRDLLLAGNREVMDYISEGYDETGGQGGSQARMIRFRCPDLSHYEWEELMQMRQEKSINDTLGNFQSLLQRINGDPEGIFARLQRLINELEGSMRYPSSNAFLRVTIKHLPDFPGENDVSQRLSGKTIILLEKEKAGRE